MDKKNGTVIYLPNEEESKQMIENALADFQKKAEEHGWRVFEDEASAALAKDIFVSGYSYGYNDGFGIIKGQLDAINLSKRLGNTPN